MNTRVCVVSAIVLLGFALVGCEDEYCMAQWLLPDGHGSHSGSSAPAGSHSGEHVSSESLSGVWRGRAGTSQTDTTLRLSQNGNSLGGSWTWGAGDRRNCKGSVSGSSVVLKDTRSDGDTWHLAISSDGRTLSGTGSKYGGGSYHVSFSR